MSTPDDYRAMAEECFLGRDGRRQKIDAKPISKWPGRG
jgi:hypothetical protein